MIQFPIFVFESCTSNNFGTFERQKLKDEKSEHEEKSNIESRALKDQKTVEELEENWVRRSKIMTKLTHYLHVTKLWISISKKKTSEKKEVKIQQKISKRTMTNRTIGSAAGAKYSK